MTKAIILVGVGGQGTITTSTILSKGLIEKGYDVKMMVAELYGQSSCQEIADKYKISKRTVIRICKDMNLEMTKEVLKQNGK